MTERGQIRIGMSGWRYDDWRGTFYPEKLAQRRELEYASRQLNSIELNGTFYSLQKPKSYLDWSKETPDDFVFSVKGTQFITHIRKLENVATPLANFLAQGLLRLGRKLGPILWQLPPNFKFDPQRLEEFLALLPHTHEQAAAYAKQRDEWMAERSWLEVEEDLPLRHAVEARNKSFATSEYISLLRKYQVAGVVADTDKWPRMMDVTADFVYCRLHGNEEVYPNGYDEAGIESWAQRVLAWSRGEEVTDGVRMHPEPGPKQAARDVFVYFDDDVKVRAPHDAMSLTRRITELTGQL
ncbi:DUF72 domain-containing protein [Occallatibacter riparius]|uniref:DUF72 domain-containing protein n=1 Tax=Occallatibacter riparius TaxID=1002689 RepID=A0A9J7BMX2_9BACT|nr:DUF72 domain-containing protein [Occallatibacter riparius]UWZ83106.1 DUF72 domain-containing protein [Occallatibacter riparius]